MASLAAEVDWEQELLLAAQRVAELETELALAKMYKAWVLRQKRQTLHHGESGFALAGGRSARGESLVVQTRASTSNACTDAEAVHGVDGDIQPTPDAMPLAAPPKVNEQSAHKRVYMRTPADACPVCWRRAQGLRPGGFHHAPGCP